MNNSMPVLPPPGMLLGLDDEYPEWYPAQDEVVSQVLDWLKSDKRFIGLSLPTGSGKTVIALIVAKLSGKRAVVCTATKSLQEQYIGYKIPWMTDIRGQNSYICTASTTEKLTAEEGPCHEGFSCPHRMSNCPYHDRLREALKSKLVVTNYHYYLAQTRYSPDGLGEVPLMVCDEGHHVKDALEGHLSVRITRDEVEKTGGSFPDKGFEEWDGWKLWATGHKARVGDMVNDYKAQLTGARDAGQKVSPSLSRAYRGAVVLERKLADVSGGYGHWVAEMVEHAWEFTPVWVRDYAQERLFREVPKVIVMSAVLTKQTMCGLGIADEDMEFLEMPSYFPPRNSPIMHIPTVRLNHKASKSDMREWVSRIDQIIDKRLDRKGIVLTVSYDRAEYLAEHSRHRGIMIRHRTRDVVAAVNKLKRVDPPAVLVSPAVTTGIDFKYGDATFLIAGKIPYPYTKRLVIKERQKEDPNWSSREAMDVLVQECGRIFRAPDDIGECFIVDDSWYWFYKRYKGGSPLWFRDRVIGTKNTIPEPPRLPVRT